ncbi:hypothetical protein [Faecalispora jeddahensis]|uniref:hypothetical protein n=1 Tax=Faecalispora jeddahensis TaxID=1414721 RepID=UPI00145B0AF3|nr:hypothetical protein [Faecalispora jeddahensis]
MAKQEIFTVTTAIQLDDGCVLPWGRTAFALTKECGEYRCECLEHTFHLVQEERQAYEKAMLERVGEQMSLRRPCGKLPHD